MKTAPDVHERNAGILLHITSLHGKYGIGSFGAEAYEFVDFLKHAGLKYWQILPLNASDVLTGYSPYSALSAFAGNVILIDPDYLVDNMLLDRSEILNKEFKHSEKADYRGAEEFRHILLDKAFENFVNDENHDFHNEYERFKEKESYWLDDYAFFITLKRFYKGRKWYKWPSEYRDREEKPLDKFRDEYAEDLEKVKFKQFIFAKQWNALKLYANDKGIALFGDIPIYVSHESSDVWAHPEFFRLKDNKSMEVVAGVPPDYFSKTGQLWNMPIYNWDFLKDRNYDWWIRRIRKNLEWYDLLRLDHFRGFSAYWEVPAGEKTAVKGKWVQGPGEPLFDALKIDFPEMPFVAEDLGKIDKLVYDLRDKYGLPGMKVLQFAFGDNMPGQPHIPHNHGYNSIVYTGTHDNNTVLGWYKSEAEKTAKSNLNDYTGLKVNAKNCNSVMLRMAFASPAKTAIVPLQDILRLGKKSRMNTPSTMKGNWLWKLRPGEFNERSFDEIRHFAEIYGRT